MNDVRFDSEALTVSGDFDEASDAEETSVDDRSISTEDLPDAAELTFEEKLAELNRTVMRHPLNREILYKTLAFCAEERPLREAEDFIAALPQFERATQNQFYMLMSLVRSYGLDMIERDEDGNRVLPEQKEGLSEDEVDDLVAEISFKSTDVGDWFVDYNKPSARLVDLLHLVPERTDTYIELLEFVEAAPRPYGQIEELLLGRPALQTVIDGRVETMQPSVFVDKLERAGALVWKEGWTLTEEGREFLEDLKVNGQA
jgi:hypothetical protein